MSKATRRTGGRKRTPRRLTRCARDTIAYYDGQEAAPGIVMDGALTLTENIADLGAMACATAVGEKTEGFDFEAFL